MLDAIQVSSRSASRPRSSPPCSACRSPGCSPVTTVGWRHSSGRPCWCRWCYRRSSAAPPCCSRSADEASSAVARLLVRHLAAVHHRRSSRRRQLRRAAVLRHDGRGSTSAGRHRPRGSSGRHRRRAAHRLRHRDRARLRDAILAGLALAWARALGEFGATITFAGNLAGRTRTLPLEIFLALESDPESAVAVGVLLLSVSFAVLIVLRGRWFSRG